VKMRNVMDRIDTYHPVPDPLPPGLDQWSPPVGLPLGPTSVVTIEDGCFFREGVSDSWNFNHFVVQRGKDTYILQDLAKPEIVDLVKQETARRIDKPVLMLDRTQVYLSGMYHSMINGLPIIVDYIDVLRTGEWVTWTNGDRKNFDRVLKPFFSILGLPTDKHLTAAPENHADYWCAPKITLSKRRQWWHRELTDVARWRKLSLTLATKVEALPTYQPRPSAGDRKFIVILSRGHGSRFLHNEAALAEALKEFGDVNVHVPTSDNVAETIAAIHQADLIVGAHGANLANLVFARRGTPLIEISPHTRFEMTNFHFWQLSAQMGLRYRAVNAPVQASDYNESEPVESKMIKSFNVDTGKVMDAAKELLGLDE